MGLTCKTTGKMRSIMKKLDNKIVKEKQLQKEKKKKDIDKDETEPEVSV